MRYTQTHVYYDPLGHYNIVIPDSWSVSSEESTDMLSDRAGSVSPTSIFIGFLAESGDPYLYKDMGVGMMMNVIDSPFLTRWHCRNFGSRPTNCTFAGVDAFYREFNMTYIVNTSHAHFQFGIVFPPEYRQSGFRNGREVRPSLPPISREQVEIVKSVIQTFTPTPNEMLKCDF